MASKEKEKVYQEITKGFKEDTIAGGKLKKDLPLLATNLKDPKHREFLFNSYKEQGLIPKKYETPDQLFGYVQKRLIAEKINKGLEPAFFNKRKGEILAELVQKEALSKLTDAQKANPEILEQISKMRWKGLPIKVSESGKMGFDRRYFQDKVSKRVIDWANGIEEGLGNKWAKEMRASWNAIGDKNRALKASSGLSFDIGHFIPSALGGPNVGSNAAPELSGLNRSKGSTPNFNDRGIARQIGVPESWMQAFTDWHLRDLGMDPNNLPPGYQISGGQVAKIAGGETEATAEISKNLRKAELDQQVLPEGKLQADLDIVNGKVVKKLTQPNQTQEILKVVKQNTEAKPIYESIVNGKKIKQAITATSKVIDRIPTKVKIAGGLGLGGLGIIGDTSAIASSLTDGEESIEQQKVNDLHAASGVLGYAGWKFPPMWAPAAAMWGLAELKQMQVDMKEQKAEDRELWYMQKYIQATDEEGMPTNATLGADTRRTGRFKR